MTSLSRESFYDAIENNIQQDTQACSALLQLLFLEREQLKERALDDLDATINAKAQWLNQLESSAKLRLQWISQSPFKHDQNLGEAWQHLLEDCGKADLAQRWQNLKNLMEQCRDENEINGKLISRSQGTFKRLVNILRGQDEHTTLYNIKGNKSEGYSKHQLGKA